MRKRTVDDKVFIDSLRHEFSDHDLIASGVVDISPNPVPRLSPVLGDHHTPLFFLRESEQDPPIEVVSEYGALLRNEPPCSFCHEDYLTRSIKLGDKYVFCVANGADLLVLKKLQWPVTTAAGLDTLSAYDARCLFGFGNSRPANRTSRSPLYHKLVLVDWDVANLKATRQPLVNAILARLADLQMTFRVDVLGRFPVWQPSAPDIGNIGSMVAGSADETLIRNAMFKSFMSSTSCRSLMSARSGFPSEYLSALHELEHAIDFAHKYVIPHASVGDALDKLHAAFAAEVTEPALEWAMAQAEPAQRAMAIAASQLVQQVHDTSDVVQRARCQAEGRNCGPRKPLSEGALDELLKTLASLQAVSKRLASSH